jgi:hypothetical protein
VRFQTRGLPSRWSASGAAGRRACR